jgi:nitrogen fixation NifU-like protein
MNDELQDLYQELILDHNARPHNFGALPSSTHYAHGLNPLCGDDIHVYLEMRDGHVNEAKFQGHGCAISKASASIMTDTLKGKDVAQVLALFDVFHRLVTGEEVSSTERAELGKVAAFSGVKEFPARVKCASLAWHTMKAALNRTQDPISTE